MSDVRLSVIVPYLDSQELMRRHCLYLSRLTVPEGVEFIFIDDGSDPPLTVPDAVPPHFQLWPTHETRPWTSSLARNRAAREVAQGEYFFMVDGDYVIPQAALERAVAFDGQRLGVRRELAGLDANGVLSQDLNVLRAWGVPEARLQARGVKIPPHPNSFVIRRDVFWRLGGYDEQRILTLPYPQGEDMILKQQWAKAREAGWAVDPDPTTRPMLYMLPNGQYCGDVDANPFGLFHGLSRKTARNYWYLHPKQA